MNWREFWEIYPQQGKGNAFAEVGKTVGGEPISDKQWRAIIEDILANLEIRAEDTVLDLCCGNGLVTRELARHCKRVLAIDFSAPLIEQAIAACEDPITEYLLGDINQLDQLAGHLPNRFDKVLIADALGYFSEADLEKVLRIVGTLCKRTGRLLLTGVLDDGRKWRFFNTWRRRWAYVFQIKLRGRDPGLGKWWPRHRLQSLAANAGWDCKFLDQNALVPTAHYRMDVVLHHAAR